MSDDVSKTFMIPSDCPKDIELMYIWAKSIDLYKSELTPEQFRAALEWFKTYIDMQIEP